MENRPNLNFSITVHQAQIDPTITPLSLNSQLQITYNGISLRTKTKNEIIPIWEETFDFEYIEGSLEVILLHNPPILKEIIIGKCLISASNASGWFDLKNFYGKTGSVRLTLKKDTVSSYPEEYQLKLIKLQIVHDELNLSKQKYLMRIEKLKKKQLKFPKTRELFKESSNNHQSFVKHGEDIAKFKYLLKTQEDNLTVEREKIENSWKEIEREKKEIEALQQKIKAGCVDLQNFKEKTITTKGPSKSYMNTPQNNSKTPVSSKSSSRISELSFTQPRSMVQLECESMLNTPKSKLIKFE